MQGQLFVVASEGDTRPGLPLWVSSLVHSLTEEEARAKHAMQRAFGQEDALLLLTAGTVWKVRGRRHGGSGGAGAAAGGALPSTMLGMQPVRESTR